MLGTGCGHRRGGHLRAVTATGTTATAPAGIRLPGPFTATARRGPASPGRPRRSAPARRGSSAAPAGPAGGPARATCRPSQRPPTPGARGGTSPGQRRGGQEGVRVRAALDPEVHGEQQGVQPRRAAAGPGPVQQHGLVVAEQDVVGPGVPVHQPVAGRHLAGQPAGGRASRAAGRAASAGTPLGSAPTRSQACSRCGRLGERSAARLGARVAPTDSSVAATRATSGSVHGTAGRRPSTSSRTSATQTPSSYAESRRACGTDGGSSSRARISARLRSGVSGFRSSRRP